MINALLSLAIQAILWSGPAAAWWLRLFLPWVSAIAFGLECFVVGATAIVVYIGVTLSEIGN